MASTGQPETSARRRSDLRALVITAGVTAAVLGIGSLVLQRWVAETRNGAIAMVVAWFVVVLVAIFVTMRGSPRRRSAALATLAAVLAGTLAIGYWTGFRETRVDEDVAVAATRASGAERAAGLGGAGAKPAPDDSSNSDKGAAEPMLLASGTVAGADGHAGSGTAEVIQQPGGERVLTLTDLSVDPGPDVDVLLSASSESVDDAINLGGLKGSSGNQQYAIPDDADLRAYPNVVLYCNPFTVRIAVAELNS